MPLDFPLNPVNGQTYETFTYDASIASWRSNPLVKGPAYISDTVPALGANGDLWFNSADGTMFVRYNGNWVESRSDETVTPGSVVQVVSTMKTDTFTTTSGTFVDVTGLAATITPKFSNSKILVSVSMPVSNGTTNTISVTVADGLNNNLATPSSPGSRKPVFAQPNTDAYTMQSAAFSFIHSPNTSSAFTYKVRVASNPDIGNTVYINRTGVDSDGQVYGRGVSSIILSEIAQ